MNNAVYLNISQHTQDEFDQIRHAINEGSSTSYSKPLGLVFSNITCEVLDQAFGDFIRQQQLLTTDPDEQNRLDESSKQLQSVFENIRKYMPWAISFFSNERLKPVVNYIAEQQRSVNNKHYLTYQISDAQAHSAYSSIEQLQKKNQLAIISATKILIKIVDLGVSRLIREPKELLKFNFVVNKTLDGVIILTTKAAYKQLEKIGNNSSLAEITALANHLQPLLRTGHPPTNEVS